MSARKTSSVKVGLSVACVPDICQTLNSAMDAKCSYLVCPIVNPRFKREHIAKNLKHQELPLSRSDMLINGDCWQNYIVGRVYQHYNCDSQDETVRRNAVAGLIEELKFTSHLNLTTIIIPIHSGKIENLAHVLNGFLSNKQFMFNILICVPMCLNVKDVEIENEEMMPNKETPWHWWCKLRTLCECNSRLSLVLELPSDIEFENEGEIDRWLAEPVKAITISTSLFLTNNSGFPVLLKAHQALLSKFFKLEIDVIIEGINRHPDKPFDKYSEYISFVHRKYEKVFNAENKTAKYTKGYEDTLQCPLQPLQDNLESQVYEIFEKDPIKYEQYKKAIAQALLDRVSEDEKATKQTVVMVVGAGRGPLVKAALRAAEETQRIVKLFAVEKNPNAVNTLRNLKNDEWGDLVTVIATDMRDLKGFNKTVDILVSELLGSFGDNELSPECLDGAQCFLKDDGISVPYRYRSFIAPVQSYKIYTEIARCREYENKCEAPYVVLMHNHCRIAEEKKLFEFVHPNKQDPIDNNRFGTVEFIAKFDSTLHGIGGYFDSHLYKDIDISITPSTHSDGLFSWFPIFFPILTPIDVKEGDKIIVTFWRKVSSKQVWYEWCVTSPRCTNIHNSNGRTYAIGL